MSLGFVEKKFPTIPRANTCGLLSPVLKGVKSKIGLPGGFGLGRNSEYSALVPKRHGHSKLKSYLGTFFSLSRIP
jgi:hypothetical protein